MGTMYSLTGTVASPDGRFGQAELTGRCYVEYLRQSRVSPVSASAAPVGSALPFKLRVENVVESSVPWGAQLRSGCVCVPGIPVTIHPICGGSGCGRGAKVRRGDLVWHRAGSGRVAAARSGLYPVQPPRSMTSRLTVSESEDE
jgi:hypothetical protein